MKDIASSTELRKWFNHRPGKFEEFKKRYKEELQMGKASLEKLRRIIYDEQKTITLLFGRMVYCKNKKL